MCVFVGEKPAPQRNQMQFQYIEKPTESEKKPKTGNDKEAEHVKNVEYLIFETRLCVEITKFQSELTKLQRTERCETQNIQRQFSFPSTNLFVTVAERQQNTTTTRKKRR